MKAVVEIPKHSRYKYEYDKKEDELVLDRVLAMKYPHNYGYIPETLFDDGDPLDVFILSEEPIVAGASVDIVPIAVLTVEDCGERDDKIIAKISDSYEVFNLKNESEIIETFLLNYKKLQPNKVVTITGYGGPIVANKTIEYSRDLFHEKN